MDFVMMKCGHSGQAVDSKGNPVCTICGVPEAYIIAEDQPNLEGRIAKCWCCNNTESSSLRLASFEYKPTEAMDGFYCGCRGWD